MTDNQRLLIFIGDMQLNVPYIPDESYTRWLNHLGKRLYAVHFSLHDPALADARIHLGGPDMQHLIDGLQGIPIPRKYLLANGRFQPAGRYLADDGLTRLIRRIEQLCATDLLDGIIFSDPYFLMILSEAVPDLAARLEAIPSINFMIDTEAKLAAVFAAVSLGRFRPPGKITLDRSLNRRPRELGRLAASIRKHYPGLKIELLANEGCLSHCPYRATHEALIAAANAGAAVDTFRLNRDLGCMHILLQTPHRILASPFIRPEDIGRYTGTADIIKICGRTLGTAFLTRTVAAYAAGAYTGNLFDLLDAANWMAEKWHLPNKELPSDLFDRLTACDGDCCNCPVCQRLFQRYAQPLPFHFKTVGHLKKNI